LGEIPAVCAAGRLSLNTSYKTPAVSGLVFTATLGLWGRINAKPTRKIPYAANTPNAIEPTVAQTNIVRFSTSAMIVFSSLLHRIYQRLLFDVSAKSSESAQT
jgi:hypothetical protein